jgi:hypothetical protein
VLLLSNYLAQLTLMLVTFVEPLVESILYSPCLSLTVPLSFHPMVPPMYPRPF